MSGTVLGLDLGGTKLLAGEMSADGTLLWEKRYDTGRLTQQSGEQLILRAVDDIMSFRGLEGLTGVGIGMPGRIDAERGIWVELETGLVGRIPIAEEIRARCHLPCFADNDVKSAAKAEYLFGVGREARSFVLINIGTGIASAYVQDGAVLAGAHDEAGETGHSASGVNAGILCSCGRYDCVESISAGIGLDARARSMAKHFPDSLLRLPPEGRVKAAEIFALWGKDPLCTVLTDDAVTGAANLIMNAIRFYDPGCVVLAGGVAMNPFFFERVMSVIPPFYREYVPLGIRQSGLKQGCAGLMGACCNAVIGLEREKIGQKI